MSVFNYSESVFSIIENKSLRLDSSPVSVAWFIDRTGDPSILEQFGLIQNPETIINNARSFENFMVPIARQRNINNINIIEDHVDIYNNIEIGTSILNTFVSVEVQENMEVTTEQLNCCICMEDRVQSDICRFSCGHTFCGNCCSSSLQSKIRCNEIMRCPLCRAEVTSVHVQNNENRDKFIVSH